MLASGDVLFGRGFGAVGSAVGEVCFHTAMTGYQEAMTDPSFEKQIITFTFPHIGNVGANGEDIEATNAHALGCIVREDVTAPSNFRSVERLDIWMKAHARIGLAGVDTRALTRRIRTGGAPNGVIAHSASGEFDVPLLLDMAKSWPGLEGMDLANGVTTVLNMGGASSDFVDQVVPAINAGRRPGPHIYLALRVDSTPDYGQLVVTSPAQARAVVGLARTNGYDFIKVYNNLAPDVFEAFIEEGRREGVPVVGHGVTRVGIERQLAAGQLMVAHLEEYLYTVFFPPDADVGTRAPDDLQIAAAVAFTRRSGAFVTADLGTYATIAGLWGHPEATAGYRGDPDLAYLDPAMRIAWRRSGYEERSGDLGARLRFLGRFARALLDAGVPLIAGTDAPTITGDYPGSSLRTDLYALHDAGFSAFQALSTATRTPGVFIARAKPGAVCFGVVAIGCRADLLLLRGNPLVDLHALEARAGVMVGGAWHSEAQLDAMLAAVARTYREAFEGPPATAHGN